LGSLFEAPHPAIVLLLILLPILSAIEVVERAPNHCKGCGYNLKGCVTGICPECGTKISGPFETWNANQ